MQQKSKIRSRAKMLTFSGGRHDAKTLCHGLFSLGVLFIGISQSFLSLLCLAKHSFLRLLSVRLSSSRNIISFSEALSSASSDAIRALAVARAAAGWGEGCQVDNKRQSKGTKQ
jgi:hypothetical protein